MSVRCLSNDRSILGQLIDRVSELSETISTISTEAEVRNTFSSRDGQQQQPLLHPPLQQQQLSQQQPQSRQDRLPVGRNTNFQTRRYFPASRPTARSSREKRRRTQSVDNRPFLRDLVLLSGPEDMVVPRQGARLVLMQNGHIITGCRFTKDLSAGAVETNILQAYDGKIPPDTDIELLTSVHASLMPPNLAPGQLLDGVMLHRIFQQKPVYIRPSRRLLFDEVLYTNYSR